MSAPPCSQRAARPITAGVSAGQSEPISTARAWRRKARHNAVCMRLVPEVFEVRDDDRLYLKTERPPDALRARVDEAVRRCPKQALSLVED